MTTCKALVDDKILENPERLKYQFLHHEHDHDKEKPTRHSNRVQAKKGTRNLESNVRTPKKTSESTFQRETQILASDDTFVEVAQNLFADVVFDFGNDEPAGFNIDEDDQDEHENRESVASIEFGNVSEGLQTRHEEVQTLQNIIHGANSEIRELRRILQENNEAMNVKFQSDQTEIVNLKELLAKKSADVIFLERQLFDFNLQSNAIKAQGDLVEMGTQIQPRKSFERQKVDNINKQNQLDIDYNEAVRELESEAKKTKNALDFAESEILNMHEKIGTKDSEVQKLKSKVKSFAQAMQKLTTEISSIANQ